jgi:hypothetical protein
MTGVNYTVLAPQEENGPTTTKWTRKRVEEQRRRGSGFDGSSGNGNGNFAGIQDGPCDARAARFSGALFRALLTTIAHENSLTTKDPSVVSKQGGEGDRPFS